MDVQCSVGAEGNDIGTKDRSGGERFKLGPWDLGKPGADRWISREGRRDRDELPEGLEFQDQVRFKRHGTRHDSVLNEC